jgi:Double zinc ribbon
VRCPNCGAEVAVAKAFCGKCGTRLSPPTCPRCAAEVEAGARFCQNCGYVLSGAAQATEPPPYRPDAVGPTPSATPYGPSAAQSGGATPPPPARSGGCAGCLFKGCLVVALLVVVLGAGGYWAFTSGAITQAKLLNLAGLGPGYLSISNFRDDSIVVVVRHVETAPDEKPIPDTLKLNAFDIRSYVVNNPGRYRVEFQATNGGASLGDCTLTVRSGDEYQFVTLPDKIAVNRANNPSKVGTDFVVQTSSLCR